MLDDWFIIEELHSDVFLIQEPGHVNAYLVRGDNHALLIDTGMGFGDIRNALAGLVETPLMVINTHWHFDHIGGNAGFDQIGIGQAELALLHRPISNEALERIYLGPCREEGLPFPPGFRSDRYRIHSPPATFVLTDGQTFDIGGRTLTALATPGHTRGSFSVLDHRSRSLFCGDLIYEGTLYAHFVDSDLGQYLETVSMLQSGRHPIEQLHPGHNEPQLPGSILPHLQKQLQNVQAGQTRPTLTNDWGPPVHRHELDDGWALLTKPEDSSGIDLWDGP